MENTFVKREGWGSDARVAGWVEGCGLRFIPADIGDCRELEQLLNTCEIVHVETGRKIRKREE